MEDDYFEDEFGDEDDYSRKSQNIFDPDDALDYIFYENLSKAEKKDIGNQNNSAQIKGGGCLGGFIFILFPIAGGMYFIGYL